MEPSAGGQSSGTEALNQFRETVPEEFELRGACHWSRHLPALRCLDAQKIYQRCAALVSKVSALVLQRSSDGHRERRDAQCASTGKYSPHTDLVEAQGGVNGEPKRGGVGARAQLHRVTVPYGEPAAPPLWNLDSALQGPQLRKGDVPDFLPFLPDHAW